MKNQRTLLRFTACLILATIMIGCPLFTGIGSTPGWRITDGLFVIPRDVKVLGDSSFFVLGEAKFSNNGGVHSYAARISEAGDLLWSTGESSPFSSHIRAGHRYAAPVGDGGFILAGLDKELSLDRSDALLFMQRIDAAGNLVWQNTFGPSVPIPASVLVNELSQIYVAGHLSNGVFSEGGLFSKIEIDGSAIETSLVESAGTGFFHSTYTNQGMIATVGNSAILNPDGKSNILLQVSDQNGHLLQQFVYDDQSNNDYASSVDVGSANDLFVVGEKGQAATLWRIAPDGMLVFAKLFIGTLSTEIRETHDCWDIAMNPDGTMIVVGLQQFTTIGAGGFFVGDDNRNFVIKLDADANIIWRKDIPNVSLYGCDVGPEGTIAVTGSAGDDLALILLDQSGNIIN